MPDSVNPATARTEKSFARHSAEDARNAIGNARAAFEEWRATPVADRAALLRRVAEVLDARRDEMARLATTEMGKRIAEARAEVEKCAWVCHYYADNAETFLADETRESSAAKSFVRYQPLGIVLAVMPWNFPYWQVFRFAAPALMAGNVGLLKHASNVPQCAMAIEESFLEAGFPQGVFASLLIGSDQVEAIIADDRVRAVTLTGSEAAGRSVAALAGKHIKPSVLELGGSDPFVVMPSADLDAAVETAVAARMINNAQSCIAAKRFIVHSDIHARFVEAMADRFQALKIGDPMDEDTELGPLSSRQALEGLDAQVRALADAGASVICGGAPVDRPGHYFEPTLIADIPDNAGTRFEELFGPVAMVFEAASIDDAVRLANETPFGLGSAVWTRDQDEIDHFVNAIEAGSVFVNQKVASDPRLPFGGVKNSGYGRELSREGIVGFVNVKTVSIA
ncbi:MULTISPECIES: NAD-dependent succinate-semialdehyde dehydrogenase [unclassified Roseitalea]|uniref:NAD-dependent succinate-semialdehyde dehydrogenase n=1 Tax=unclassified Roseitalea TaxID=2639107 RepID=UPI00273D201C|nr:MULTISPECIES: NAD-dependent succinate-semialdehyde dehydrogenase [unclassified Roseitalea]